MNIVKVNIILCRCIQDPNFNYKRRICSGYGMESGNVIFRPHKQTYGQTEFFTETLKIRIDLI